MIKQLNKIDKISLFGGFGCIYILMLSIFFQSNWLFYFDNSFLSLSGSSETSTLIEKISIINNFGSPIISLSLCILIIIFFLWNKQRYTEAIWAVMLIITGNIACFLLRELVRRPRPFEALIHSTKYSFPSASIFSIMILVFLIWHFVVPDFHYLFSRITMRLLLIFWIIAVSLIKIYLCVVFPSDVLASIFLSIGMESFTKLGLKPMKHYKD